MARKYYLIPLMESQVYFNGTPFNELTEKMYPGIALLEQERLEMLNSRTPFCKVTKEEVDKYNHHIDDTNLIYDTLCVPHYIIACGTEKEALEIITGTKITPVKKGALSEFETPDDLAQDYFEDSDYKIRIASFYSQYIEDMKNPFDTSKATSRTRRKKSEN